MSSSDVVNSTSDDDINDDSESTDVAIEIDADQSVTPISTEEDEIAIEERKKLAELEEQRYQQIKEKQAHFLKELKEKESLMGSKFTPIDSLAQQAEIYTSFMARKKIHDVGLPAEEKHVLDSINRRNRMSETEEDTLLSESDTLPSVTHLTTQPGCIVNGSMRSYQIEGLNWLIALYDTNINGILADEMGLGKTLQTISLLGYLYEYRAIEGPHIVIVPKSTISNWRREFSKWCPSLSVLVLQGDQESRTEMIRGQISSGAFNVLITSYEIVLREKNALMPIAWSYLVIDEAHRIKNEASALSIVVRQLQTHYRLLITGTPLQNNLHELWSLLNFLMPTVFDSADVFDSYFKTTVQSDVVRRLHTILRPFLLRRLKTDVEKDLPPKKEVKLYVGLTDMQLFWYKNVLRRDIEALNSIGGASRMQLANVLMQLRKVCNHPYLFQGAEPGPPYSDGPHIWENSGKMLLLDKLLRKMKEQDSRVLIFSQMTRMLDILEDYMRYKGYEYCRIDGQTNVCVFYHITVQGEDREIRMDEFNKPESSKFCFLLSTRAGGLGINLATADVVILYDSDWNPQADLQAQDRAHRIGQKKMVRVFRLITERSVEEKIIERAEKKLLLDAVVIQQGRLTGADTKLSTKEMASMVTYGADSIVSSEKGTYTDEDIDKILQYGEERSQQESQQLRQSLKSLSNFSLDGKDEIDIYSFGGENFRNKGVISTFINLPARSKKRLHNDSSSKHEKVEKLYCPYQDFQLYNVPALQAILAKENQFTTSIRVLTKRMKEFKGRAEKGDAAAVQAVSILQQQIEECRLTEDDQKEKEALLKEGFPEWSRSDFRHFVQACESHGRHCLQEVVSDVMQNTGKSNQEIRCFIRAFWNKVNTTGAFKKVITRIEKGEEKLSRHQSIQSIISKKISEYLCPYDSFSIMGTNLDGSFSDENDRFLLCALAQMGYGSWDAIQQEIQKCDQFRFDWYFRTRSPTDIQRRCDTIIRLIEKEQEDAVSSTRVKRGKKNDSDEDDIEMKKEEQRKNGKVKRRRKIAKSPP